MKLYLVLISILVLYVCSCARTSVRIASNPPGADVLVKSVGGGEMISAGKTPLNLPANQIEKSRGGAGPVMVVLRKEGYEDVNVLVTDVSAIDLSIQQEMTKRQHIEDIERINGAIDKLFEAQRLVKVNRLDDAVKLLEELEKNNPELSSIYEVKGGIFYLQKKYPQSIDSYRQAARLNVNNIQVNRMINLLEEKYGQSRTPSGKSK